MTDVNIEAKNEQALQELFAREYKEKSLRDIALALPREFYKKMYELNRWPENIVDNKKPKIIARYVKEVIFDKLPVKTAKDMLERHLIAVMTLMKVSANWRKFTALLNRAFEDESK